MRNGGFGPGDRNAGLREALQSDSGRARNAAFRDDKTIQAAIASSKITQDELVAHHLIPMEAVTKFPAVFGPAAEAGWRPDAASNLVSDSARCRDAGIRDDKPIQDALAAGRITREELVAHHLIPMQAVRDFPEVFGPAADAG